MQKIQPRLTVAFFFTTLVVLAYFGLVLVSGPIDFLYRNTAGLSTAHDIAQIVALLATLLVFITGLIIAIPTALQPGNLLQKLINVLPVYFLGFLLAGVVAYEINIGAVGTLLMLPQVGPIDFIQTWLMLAAILSTIGVVIAAARARLGDRVLRSAVMTTDGKNTGADLRGKQLARRKDKSSTQRRKGFDSYPLRPSFFLCVFALMF